MAKGLKGRKRLKGRFFFMQEGVWLQNNMQQILIAHTMGCLFRLLSLFRPFATTQI